MYIFRLVRFYKFNSEIFEDWSGLGYLVTALKDIDNLKVDVSLYKLDDIDIAVEEIANENPDVIGVSILQENYFESFEFIAKIKELLPQVHITLGNREPSYHPIEIMKRYAEVDSIMIGEGEETIKELTMRLMNGHKLDGCKGACFRRGQEIVKNDMRPLVENLDSLGFPDRTFVKKKDGIFVLLASRGCLGHCTFCDGSSFSVQPGARVRTRSMNSLLDEIEFLINTYNARYIHFEDSTFCKEDSNPNNWYIELYNGLMMRNINIRFYFNLRAELINEECVQVLKKLMEVGLDRVYIGIDSGNEEDQRLYGKRANIDNNERAINLLREHNIPFNYGFIMFNPYSTFERLYANLEFVERNDLFLCPKILWSRLYIYSGSSIIYKLAKDGLLDCDVSLPITNRLAYHFLDSRIEEAWKAINYVYTEVPDHKYDSTTIESLYNSLFNSSTFSNRELIRNFQIKIKEYEKTSTQLSLWIMRKILVLAEAGQHNIVQYIEDDVKKMKAEIKQRWKEVTVMKLRYGVALKRKGELYA